jgi:hypothetical protein
MKRLIYAASLLACMLLCGHARGNSQGELENSRDTTSTHQSLRLYNLFYLSQYLPSYNSLSVKQKEEVYQALVELVGKDKIDNLGTSNSQLILNVKNNYLQDKRKEIEAWFSNFIDNPDVDMDSFGQITIEGKTQKLSEWGEDLKSLDLSIKESDQLIKSNRNKIEEMGKDTLHLERRIEHVRDSILSRVDTSDVRAITLVVNAPDSLIRLDSTCFIEIIRILDKEKNGPPVTLQQYVNSYKTQIRRKIRMLVKSNRKSEADKKSNQGQYDKLLDSLLTYLTEQSIEVDLVDIKKMASTASPNSTTTAGTHLQIVTTSQNAQQGLSYSGLSIPSQSQMIEAMAIFLAKRAKQEAAIWFMDQLRARVQNPLVYDTFPETIALLESMEDYHTANFGKSWRNAIATDFVEMPKNLANSVWLEEVLPKESQEELRTAVAFGYDLNDLILQRYNYRDIIRNLYLNPKYNTEKNKLAKTLHQSFSLLYMITNELFTIHKVADTDTFRLLSYEELSTLNKEQWQTFVQLLHVKYGQDFEDIYTPIEAQIRNTSNAQEILTKWISTLLITLAQFDRINQEQQQLRASNNLDADPTSLSSVWKVLNQVIQRIDVRPYTGNAYPGEVSAYVRNIQDVLGIIENIQQKNFVAATQKSLKLIEQYYNIPNIRSKRLASQGNDHFLKIENGRMTMLRGQDNISANIKSESLECLSITKADNSTIVVNYMPKDKKRDISLTFDANLLRAIQTMGALSNKMNNKDAIKFILESSYGDENIREFVNQFGKLNSKSTVEVNVLKAIALYANLQDTLQPVEKQKRLFSDISFRITDIINSDAPTLPGLALDKRYIERYGEQLVKLTSFFGDVIATSDATQLANVIESYALPPTSYKVKHRMAASVDINAYVGAFGAYMFSSSTASLKKQLTGGITAPIGVTIKNNGWLKKVHMNVQLIDLGNIVNHYLVTPDSAYNKEVHFTEVFSPGVNLLLPIKNTPLVIFCGISGLPLRSHMQGDIIINNKIIDVWTVKLGMKLDIPLLNLYSRTPDK